MSLNRDLRIFYFSYFIVVSCMLSNKLFELICRLRIVSQSNINDVSIRYDP